MMLSEKAAYIKGLMDGMGLDTTKGEGKLFAAIQELLAEISEQVETTQGDVEQVFEEMDQVFEELDAIDEDMDELESIVYDEGEDFEDEEDLDEFGLDYELTCPKCGTVTAISEETLLNEEICCPECGADFEIAFEDEDDEEE